MKIIIFIFLLAFVMACSNNSQNTESRNITIETTETQEQSMEKLDGNGFLIGNNRLNLGEFSDNDTIICKFTFINQGSEPLEILEHSVSCDCTRLDYKRNAIMINDTIVFTMIIHTKDKREGDHFSSALIKTNGKRRFYDLIANFTVTQD